MEYRRLGERVWDYFKGGREGTLWYYRSLANTFLELGNRRMAEELDRTVQEMERLVDS